jgi:hypothetical protein
MYLRKALPEHHLNAESRDLVKLGVGLIATMSALVLGLLVASAKGSYDTQRNEVLQLSGKVVLLDRILAHYGPEAKEARDLLKPGRNRFGIGGIGSGLRFCDSRGEPHIKKKSSGAKRRNEYSHDRQVVVAS